LLGAYGSAIAFALFGTPVMRAVGVVELVALTSVILYAVNDTRKKARS
jgi:hypothetical protein